MFWHALFPGTSCSYNKLIKGPNAGALVGTDAVGNRCATGDSTSSSTMCMARLDANYGVDILHPSGTTRTTTYLTVASDGWSSPTRSTTPPAQSLRSGMGESGQHVEAPWDLPSQLGFLLGMCLYHMYTMHI